LHFGGDPRGRKGSTERWARYLSEGEQLDVLGIQQQASAPVGRPLPGRLEAQYVLPREPVLRREEPLHGKPPVQVVAGEQKERRLTRWKQAPAHRVPHASQFGILYRSWQRISNR